MSDVAPETQPPPPKPPLFSGEPFERMIALLIALTTVLAGVVALLEADASAQVAQATRQAQQYAIQAIGVKAGGQAEAGYAWTEAYRRWLEWDTLVFLAEQQDDSQAVHRYAAVRNRTAELSPLLTNPYFNPDSGQAPNIRAYEASVYLVPHTILAERFINTMALAGALEDKEKAYGAHLLLLAVSLFLFGLSTTIVGRMRWLFMGMGSLLVNITLVWLVLTYISPVMVFSDEAIVAYAEGVGLAHQTDYAAAVDSFDQALDLEPTYANAYYARANAYFDRSDYEQAARDYLAAIEAGRADVNAAWNLGWAYYVLGQFDKSTETTQTALVLDESQVALHFNLALAHLAEGNLETAQEIYRAGIENVTQQVAAAKKTGQEPPASLWWYLDTAAADLDRFITCLSTQVCRETPSYQTIAVSDSLTSTAQELRTRLKELTVALELTGQPPAGPVEAAISQLDFGAPVYDEQGQLVGFQALGADTQIRFGRVQEEQGQAIDPNITRASADESNQIFVLFDYSGLAAGQLLTIKIYKDEQESLGLRLVENWNLNEAGQAALPLTPGARFALAPGDYEVELYIDSHLLQEGKFTITGN